MNKDSLSHEDLGLSWQWYQKGIEISSGIMFGVWIKDVAYKFLRLWDGLPLHWSFHLLFATLIEDIGVNIPIPVDSCDDGFLLCNMKGLDNPKDLKDSFQIHHIFCYLQYSNTTVTSHGDISDKSSWNKLNRSLIKIFYNKERNYMSTVFTSIVCWKDMLNVLS